MQDQLQGGGDCPGVDLSGTDIFNNRLLRTDN